MPGNFTDYFTTLGLVVFAKKQLSCNFQAGWPWMSEEQARPQGHSTPVTAGLPRGHVPCRGPGTGSQAVSFPQGLGWGTKSEKQLCTIFPPPSCPARVWGLVSLLSGTSPWEKNLKFLFFSPLFYLKRTGWVSSPSLPGPPKEEPDGD